jgi:AAA domain
VGCAVQKLHQTTAPSRFAVRKEPLFIPEWNQANARERAIKPVLSGLEAAYIIRRPLRSIQRKCPVDVFIEHPEHGWLILVVDDIDYSDLAQVSMIGNTERDRFEQRLADIQAFAESHGFHGRSNQTVRVTAMLIMSRFKSEQAESLMASYYQRYKTAVMSLDKFKKMGTATISRYASILNAAQIESMRTLYFPETEIAPTLTARQFLNQGQTAALPKLYLDADQEWASKLDLEIPEQQEGISNDIGVRLVNGIAGSGKTLIAISRALMLAKIHPDHQVLFLIHNTPVVADIKAKLHQTLGSLPKNLVIETFFGWLVQQWKAAYKQNVVMMDTQNAKTLVEWLRQQQPDSILKTQQILDEIDFINHMMLLDEATYLEVQRTGRGAALQKTQRREMWQFHTALSTQLHKMGQQTWSSLPSTLCRDEQAIIKVARYEHVLIDEAQFFAPSWFELVKKVLTDNGRLFLCADPNQGFLKTRLSWRRAGLDVTGGRTKWLKHSYRTTRAILQAAHRLLPESKGTDKENYLQPDFDGMREGTRPMLVYVGSPANAVTRLIREIKAQRSGENALPLSAMLVLYGDNIKNKRGIWEELRYAVGDNRVWWFNQKDQKKEPPDGYDKDYLRMAYLDTATGLEASVVFLIGMENILLGHRPLDLTDEEWDAEREDARRKMYMAMTRAGHHLVLISADKLPDDIAASFEHNSV